MRIDSEGHCCLLTVNAHAGSRTRVTSMGGLYDAATLRALLHAYLNQATQAMRFARMRIELYPGLL